MSHTENKRWISSPRTGDSPLQEYRVPALPLHSHHWRADDENAPTIRPLELVEHVPNQSTHPAVVRQETNNRIWIVTGWEVPESPLSRTIQLRQSPPDVPGTLTGPRGPESASLPPQPSTSFAWPTAFLPRDLQENLCTGHKSSWGKDRENLT